MDSVNPSTVEGIWEAVVVTPQGKKLAYIDSKAKFLVSGSIVELATGTDLTRQRGQEMNKVDFASIALDDAIVLGNPNAAKKVVVFDNPDWPYCAKLHQVMKQVVSKREDVTFYLKMFPLVSIHPEAYAKSKTIVCAIEKGDNEQALKFLEDVYAGKQIPAPTCETAAVDESLRAGQSIGVRSTPTMVFQSGRIVPGAIDENALNSILDQQ